MPPVKAAMRSDFDSFLARNSGFHYKPPLSNRAEVIRLVKLYLRGWSESRSGEGLLCLGDRSGCVRTPL